MTRRTHRWGDPARFTYKTERVCTHCGMVKVTWHQGEEHWSEFYVERDQDGEVVVEKLEATGTPECPGAVAQAARAA